MNVNQLCPICDRPLETWESYSEHGIEEEDHKCIQCEFYYQVSYGVYRRVIGEHEWTWAWNTPMEDLKIIDAETKAVIHQLRTSCKLCKRCHATIVPTLANPGQGLMACAAGWWEDYSPPEEGFNGCIEFEDKQEPDELPWTENTEEDQEENPIPF